MPKRHYRTREKKPNPLALLLGIILLAIGCPSIIGFTSIKEYFFPLFLGGLIVSIIAIGVFFYFRKEQRALQTATNYQSIKNISDLRPRELEELAARVYAHLGYRNVKHTGSSSDGGVDVWMLNGDGDVEIVQCKKLSSRIDRPKVVDFAKTMRKQHAKVGHYWAPNEFTQPAIDYAKEHNIKLYEERGIMYLVKRAFPIATEPIKNTETLLQISNSNPSISQTNTSNQLAPNSNLTLRRGVIQSVNQEGIKNTVVVEPGYNHSIKNGISKQKNEKRYFGMNKSQIIVLAVIAAVFIIILIIIFGIMIAQLG
jgi:hypothetical protein